MTHSNYITFVLLASLFVATSGLLWNASPFSWIQTMVTGPMKLGSSLRSYVSGVPEPPAVVNNYKNVPVVPVGPQKQQIPLATNEIPNLLDLVRPRIIFEDNHNNNSSTTQSSATKRKGEHVEPANATKSVSDLRGLDNFLQHIGLNRNGKKPEDILSQVAFVDLTPLLANNVLEMSSQGQDNSFGLPSTASQKKQPEDISFKSVQLEPASIVTGATLTTEQPLIQTEFSTISDDVTTQKEDIIQESGYGTLTYDNLPQPVYRPNATEESVVVFQRRQGEDLSNLRYHMFKDQLLGLETYIREHEKTRLGRNESDEMQSDQASSSPILEDYENYFMVVKNGYDNESCVSLLVCEISANPDQFGSYGQRVADFFRNYQPSSESYASQWYKTVARMGFKSKSSSLCKRAFNTCRSSVKKLLQFGEKM